MTRRQAYSVHERNCHLSENGDKKVENIFQQPVGIDAIFEFRPNNYEMNNKDTILIARKITKKIVSSQLSSSASQITILTEQNTNVNNGASQSTYTTSTTSDYKGKKPAVHDILNESTESNPPSSTTKKGGRRELYIADEDNVGGRIDSIRTQCGEKRRKK